MVALPAARDLGVMSGIGAPRDEQESQQIKGYMGLVQGLKRSSQAILPAKFFVVIA